MEIGDSLFKRPVLTLRQKILVRYILVTLVSLLVMASLVVLFGAVGDPNTDPPVDPYDNGTGNGNGLVGFVLFLFSTLL